MTKTKAVFVLGAGFTRAFVPAAPLLVDTYDIAALLDKFHHFHHARRLLELEVNQYAGKMLNLERLLTRLDEGMPYDSEVEKQEGMVLLSELKRAFQIKLVEARRVGIDWMELGRFARHLLGHGISCVTFNYDDLVDEALWRVNKLVHVTGEMKEPYWHPDGGYGFFCRPAAALIEDTNIEMDITDVRLLKLHGSVNWRVRRGWPKPYVVDAMVHLEEWYPLDLHRIRRSAITDETVERHLEPEPFTVPPVIVKRVLLEQPILKLTWGLAYQALKEASEVVFLGYSFPVTDLGARFLFAEALADKGPNDVFVVNQAFAEYEKDAIRSAYRGVFPKLPDRQCFFGGVVAWWKTI